MLKLKELEINEYKNVCFTFKAFETLFLMGDYETIGDNCNTPWNCKSCETMLEYCLKKQNEAVLLHKTIEECSDIALKEITEFSEKLRFFR